MEKKTYYISTPIYYPSDKLHIGHSYCTVAADTIARFKRQLGFDVHFLTGTDEHGQKIERVAKANNTSPQAYVDGVVEGIKELWKLLDISYDDFIRTTDERHIITVQKIFKQLYEQGDIYKSAYTGWYCTPCESFWLERQLKDGCCPDCGRPVEQVQEESYFFRLSKYADRLIEHIKNNPEFIQPPSRTNEMLQNFLLPGLEDLAVSRTSFKWGIPVDFDDKHVVYVWLDALSNYITALGYLQEDDSLFQKFWPADVHLVGKEIVRFHTIIWPIMLMALNVPLPKKVYGHGWLILEGGKMSKSKGNVIDPVKLVNRYGVDAIRYFLLREVAFGSDGLFSNEALLYRINSDLANDLGNLLSRTVAMIEKYFDGRIPAPAALSDVDIELCGQGAELSGKVEVSMESLKFSDALSDIWKFVGACNKYIDVTAPWLLAKNEQDKPRLGTVLYNLAESLRIVGILLQSFMTRTSPRIFEQIGLFEGSLTEWDSARTFGLIPAGSVVKKGDALFPRIDIPKELEALAAEQEQQQAEALLRQGLAPMIEEKDETPKAEKSTEAPAQKSEPVHAPEAQAEITIDDFAKIDLRLAKVISCELIEGADKLLKLTVKMGNEERVICSGIRKWYAPEDLIGKSVVVVANLKPRKMRGILSHGMILAASDDDDINLSIVTTAGELEDGCKVR